MRGGGRRSSHQAFEANRTDTDYRLLAPDFHTRRGAKSTDGRRRGAAASQGMLRLFIYPVKWLLYENNEFSPHSVNPADNATHANSAYGGRMPPRGLY